MNGLSIVSLKIEVISLGKEIVGCDDSVVDAGEERGTIHFHLASLSSGLPMGNSQDTGYLF